MARRQSADAFGEATRLAPQRYSANGGRVRRFGRAARLDFRLRRCKRRSPRSPDTSLGLWIGDTRFGAVGEPVTDVPDRFLTSPSAPATFRLPPEAVCLSPRLLRLRPFTRGMPSGRRSPRRDRCIRRGPCISLPDYQSVPAPGMAAQRSDSLLRGVSRLPS